MYYFSHLNPLSQKYQGLLDSRKKKKLDWSPGSTWGVFLEHEKGHIERMNRTSFTYWREERNQHHEIDNLRFTVKSRLKISILNKMEIRNLVLKINPELFSIFHTNLESHFCFFTKIETGPNQNSIFKCWGSSHSRFWRQTVNPLALAVLLLYYKKLLSSMHRKKPSTLPWYRSSLSHTNHYSLYYSWIRILLYQVNTSL